MNAYSDEPELSWGSGIVIAEPAPRLARPARYLAPLVRPFNEVVVMVGALFVLVGLIFSGGLIIGALLAVIGELFGVDHHIVRPILVVLLFGSVLGSYVLIARYGIRYLTPEAANAAEVINIAWRSLPALHRDAEAERLRSANAAARLLQVDPDDAAAFATLTEHARYMHDLTRKLLGSETELHHEEQQASGQ